MVSCRYKEQNRYKPFISTNCNRPVKLMWHFMILVRRILASPGTLKVYNKNNFDYALAQNLEVSSFQAGDTLILEVQDADLNSTDVIAQVARN